MNAQATILDMQATFARPAPRSLGEHFREWTIVDKFVAVYLAVLVFAAVQGSGPDRLWCIGWCIALLVAHLTTVVAVRSRVFGEGRVVGLWYRFVAYGTVQVSYFLLRWLLPTARHVALDADLFALDVRLFGVEPTLVLDHFVTPARTEWFAFFYFGYFPLLAVHVLPFLFASRRRALFAEFAMGTLMLFCTAHVLYMIVPGYGPYRFLASQYQHALPHGRFYDLVISTVTAAGAQKDIFPSVHTAAPTFLAIFSYKHRDQRPFSFTWPLTAIGAANIIGATIFLRWHYAIDVLAGITLAATAANLAAWLSAREEARRAALGLSKSWAGLWPEREPRRAPELARPEPIWASEPEREHGGE